MELFQNYIVDTEHSKKFKQIAEELFALTQSRLCDRKLLNEYIKTLNEIDYRQYLIKDKNAVMLLVHQLCSIIQPSDVSLVTGFSQLIVNLIKKGINLESITFNVCKRWVLECLEFSESTAVPHILTALQSLYKSGPLDSIILDFRKILSENSILLRHIYPKNDKWNEEQFLALSCLQAFLINNEKNEGSIPSEYLSVIKSISLQILNKLSYEDLDKFYFNKTASLCLKILRDVLTEKSTFKNVDFIGEILGLVQAFLFHGIEGYPNIKPQLLRPSTLNLPDITYPALKKKYFRNHKTKTKKPTCKKVANDNRNLTVETKASIKQSSDSDTSDSENRNITQSESKVRLEAAHLMNFLVVNVENRQLFGFWTQIVASGCRPDARVLTRSILRETVSKVRQIVLSTLNDLLSGAKKFLSHAEDVEQMSFVTFFGVLSSLIREIHFTLSLLLCTERNIVVLTQGLKCATALAQGTPYSRLKPGLATKLIRNCRYHLSHKDPTVRVAALSVFEALTLSEPLTQEIFNILAKSSSANTNTELSNDEFNTANDTENEEIVYDDFHENVNESNYENKDDVEEIQMSALIQCCLNNILNETMNEPVKLQSLKLLGTLAFNASSLVLAHLEVITRLLVNVTKEPQGAFHACRVLEIIAGRLSDLKSENVSVFWNIAFNCIISLVQHPVNILREVACDCLGNIGEEMFAQLSRDKNVLVITVLFGAVRDVESAVRAASLRALGLLVSLSTLEEDTGFLMDLIDITCSACEDRNLGVRIKAIWALASLCDCLVKRENNPDLEPISLELVLPKLFKISVKMIQYNEKVKCNAVRAIGNVLYLCPDRSILQDTSPGLDALIHCATIGNDSKVRWNACRAIGIVLSKNPDEILPSLWKDKVFTVLCDLVCNSPNFKVRTNAAWALSVCESYDKYIVTLWKSVMLGLENSQHVPSYVEYPHRDALVQQLCLTLCHLAVHTDITDLESLWIEIKDHIDDISHHIKQFQEHVLPEKAGDLIKAKAKFASFIQQAKKSNEKLFATKLLELFKRDERYDDVDAMSILN